MGVWFSGGHDVFGDWSFAHWSRSVIGKSACRFYVDNVVVVGGACGARVPAAAAGAWSSPRRGGTGPPIRFLDGREGRQTLLSVTVSGVGLDNPQTVLLSGNWCLAPCAQMSRLVTAYQSSLVELDVCVFWSGLEWRRLRIAEFTKLTPEKICTIHTHTLSLPLSPSVSRDVRRRSVTGCAGWPQALSCRSVDARG